MTGIKALRQLQFGAETVAGTPVTPTALVRLEGNMTDTTKLEFPMEDVGILSGTDRSYIATVGSELGVSGDVTFEQLPYFLNAGIMATSASQDGAGSDYIYEYNFPTTSQNTPKTYSIIHGDNQAAEKTSFAFVREMTLSGKSGEAWMLDATFEGVQLASATFEALSVPTVETAIFTMSKLYIGSASDTLTATAPFLVSNTLLSASLKITSGFMGVRTADGSKAFSFIKQVPPEVTLEMTFEHNADATGEKAAWLAQTPSQILLVCEGSALTSAGTVYSKKTFSIKLSGKWETFSALDEQDGNDIVTGTFRMRYNGTTGYAGQLIVANELSALP